MIVCRRNSLFVHNNGVTLTLNLNPGKFALSMMWGILTNKSKNSILNLFLIRNLVLAYKLPHINLLKTKFNINPIKNISVFVQISSFLNRLIWQTLLFKLKYRYYSFQEKLFIRKRDQIELYFIKLPSNSRWNKLEAIESGESFNFKLCIFGRYTYLEMIYILNTLGFTNLHDSCNLGGLDFENIEFLKYYNSDKGIFFKLNN
jgi:hypothetical protein